MAPKETAREKRLHNPEGVISVTRKLVGLSRQVVHRNGCPFNLRSLGIAIQHLAEGKFVGRDNCRWPNLGQQAANIILWDDLHFWRLIGYQASHVRQPISDNHPDIFKQSDNRAAVFVPSFGDEIITLERLWPIITSQFLQHSVQETLLHPSLQLERLKSSCPTPPTGVSLQFINPSLFDCEESWLDWPYTIELLLAAIAHNPDVLTEDIEVRLSDYRLSVIDRDDPNQRLLIESKKGCISLSIVIGRGAML